MKKLLPLILCALTSLLATSQLQAQTIYALSNTGNQINVISSASPATLTKTITVTGITPGSEIVGMDFRPATGQLYILGYISPVVKTAQLYTVDTANGLASMVGSPLVNFNIDGQVAFDFNPTVDRIRVETSEGFNYRLHPVTGAIAATDSTLRFNPTDVNAGKPTNIGTAAYTNSFIASTTTSLLVYDDSLNVFCLQSPPNNGVLNTLYSSGIVVNPADPSSDFDIWFDKISSTNKAFFVANTGGSTTDTLYSLNTTTGALTAIGAIGNNLSIKDIAVLIDRTAPAQSGSLVYAVSSNSNLLTFRTGTPDYILSATPITGVTTGYTVRGTDFRPLTGELYAFAYNTSTSVGKIYTINRNTAIATQVGTDSLTTLGIAGTGQINFDFNPTVDRIRLSSSNNKNFRLNPITGALAATDLNIQYASTDPNAGVDPFAGAVAYTNSYAGATGTTLFVFDDSLGVFATQSPPNNGTLNTIGNAGLSVNLADPSSDFDILFDSLSSTNMAYFNINTGSSTFDKLYTVNLSTGATTLVGSIGLGVAVTDIALVINRVAPAISGPLVYAVTSNNQLVSFYTGSPHYIRSQVAVGGIPAGYDIVGSDFRNVNGQLHALAYNATTQTARIYTVNETTGIITAVSADSITPIDLSGRVAVDFNPTVDRLRVETSNNKNYRMHPVTGLLVSTDMELNYAAGDVNNGVNPNIGSAAYLNARAGATTTTLYVYDDSLNVLGTQVPPNNGTINTLGNSGIVQSTTDQTSDLDIYYNSAMVSDQAFLVSNTSGSNDNFYSINLSSGAATLVSKIGMGSAVKDIAIKPDAASVGINTIDPTRYQLNLSPNPVKDAAQLKFNLTEAQDYSVRIIDITGRTVSTIGKRAGTSGQNSVTLLTSDYRSGLYLVAVELENGENFVVKMVK